MKILYFILGSIAATNEWLSRKSFNFLQLNWLLLGTLGCFCYFTLIGIYESFAINHTPEKIKISEIDNSYVNNKRYVTVNGHYLYDMAIKFGSKKKISNDLKVKFLYIPLLDKTESKYIYIKEKADVDLLITNEEEKEITGMIELIPPDVASEIKKNPIEENIATEVYSINPEMKPRKPNLAIFLFVLFGIPSIGFFYTWIKRYKIIQINPEKIFTSTGIDQFAAFEPGKKDLEDSPSDFIEGNFTGKLQNENGGNRFFVMVPTRINFLEEGSVFCISVIDASSSFFGFKTSDKKELWTMLFQKGNIKKIENVYQYFRFKRKKAIFIQSYNGLEQVEVVLALENDEDLSKVYSNLKRLKEV